MKHKFLLSIAVIFLLFGSTVFAQKQTAALSLRTLDGGTISASNLRGQATVLIIGASWLPLSRDQVKIANKLQSSYEKRGAKVYFVFTDADTAKSKNYATDAQIRTFGESNKLTANILRDPTGSSLKVFAIDQIPAFVVLNKEGKTIATFSGVDEENDLSTQIAAKIADLL